MISLTEHPNSLLLRYQASIEKIDYEDEKVLIHYRQWSHRYDEWFGWTSPYLRPLERIHLRREGLQDNQPRPTPVRETRTHTQLSFCPNTLQTPARFKKA